MILPGGGVAHLKRESIQASKATPSMVYHIGRAPEHGASQGIEHKLTARPLTPRCGATYGQLGRSGIATPGLAQQCP